MRVVFLRNAAEAAVFVNRPDIGPELDAAALAAMGYSDKASSSSKRVIQELLRRGVVAEAEEWKFWDRPSRTVESGEAIPLRLFQSDPSGRPVDLAEDVRARGAPHILWLEGSRFGPHVQRAFELCPGSFKVLYSKDWRPWKAEAIERYDLCLVDEEWQVAKMAGRVPSIRIEVWDKFVDYEHTTVPLYCQKRFDICMVAYLRSRKRHDLLLEAVARLSDRRLSCVIVGDDPTAHRGKTNAFPQRVRALAHRLGIEAHFTGEVDKAAVNRYVNQSRIGVICSKKDAAPRAMLEYMAADVPVLVNEELYAGKRYVGPRAGMIRPPEEFHLGIAELLDNLDAYSPREYLLQHYSRERAGDTIVAILERAGVLARAAV